MRDRTSGTEPPGMILGVGVNLRPTREHDLELLTGWFARPDVNRYWGGVPLSIDAAVDERVDYDAGKVVVRRARRGQRVRSVPSTCVRAVGADRRLGHRGARTRRSHRQPAARRLLAAQRQVTSVYWLTCWYTMDCPTTTSRSPCALTSGPSIVEVFGAGWVDRW